MLKEIHIIILIILVGCASVAALSRKPTSRYKKTYKPNLLIKTTNKEEALQIDHAIKILMAWEKDFKKLSKPVELTIVPGEYFSIPDIGKVYGCYYGDGKISVAEGKDRFYLASLYHELCHRNEVSVYGVDHKHADPRWSLWRKRGLELSELK